MTELLATSHPQAIERALKVLHRGGLVAFPTDTVYGLGSLAFDRKAVLRIYMAKGRGGEKAIPILLANKRDLPKVALDPPAEALRLIERFWPGPLTLILWRAGDVPSEVSPYPTVAVRAPDHPFALELLQVAGPMAVTSANLTGEPSACTASRVMASMRGRLELILDGGETPSDQPSTIVDCTKPNPVVLREGPLSYEQILEAL